MNAFYVHCSMGDIIYALPAIKAMGGGILYTGLSREQHEYLKPLVEVQPYIQAVRHESEGLPPAFYNLNDFRFLQRNPRHICQSFAASLGIKVDYWTPWLTLPGRPPQDHRCSYAVINITGRYRDKLYNYNRELRRISRNRTIPIYFLGLWQEYEDFRKLYPRWSMKWVKTINMLDVATAIWNAMTFTGTQSSCLAIAEGLGRSYRFERSPFHDNCMIGRPNETVLNNHTRKIHLALSRLQEVYRVFKS